MMGKWEVIRGRGARGARAACKGCAIMPPATGAARITICIQVSPWEGGRELRCLNPRTVGALDKGCLVVGDTVSP